jgi:ABC-type uncharacterized transport system permease subunit
MEVSNMRNVKLALLNIKKNFQNAKELKSAFITSIVGMCINNIAFIVLWYYFGKMVGNINGWEPFDIFGLYGFSATSFGLVCSFFYGVYNIPTYISTGSFDKYLLTPKNTLLKVSTSAISTSAIGDLVFGIICFVIYGSFFAGVYLSMRYTARTRTQLSSIGIINLIQTPPYIRSSINACTAAASRSPITLIAKSKIIYKVILLLLTEFFERL